MAAESQTSLLDLPTELLEFVAEGLDSASLFALRLSSKDIGEKLLLHLARTYFTQRHILVFEPASMDSLIQVSKHPILHKFVREIVFNIAILRYKGEYQHKYSLRKASGVSSATQSRRLFYEAYRRHQKAVYQCVKDVLVAFSSNKYVPELETCSTLANPEEDRLWGLCRLRRQLGEQLLAIPIHLLKRSVFLTTLPDQYPYTMLLRAIVSSQYPVTRLVMGGQCYGIDPLNIIQAVELQPKPARPPFEHLRTLKLRLDTDSEDVDANSKALLWIVSQAQQLENFSLVGRSIRPNRGFDKHSLKALATRTVDGMPAPLQRIQQLELIRHDIPKATLLAFIREHKCTLKFLSLWDIHDGYRDDPSIEGDVREAIGGANLELSMGYGLLATRHRPTSRSEQHCNAKLHLLPRSRPRRAHHLPAHPFG